MKVWTAEFITSLAYQEAGCTPTYGAFALSLSAISLDDFQRGQKMSNDPKTTLHPKVIIQRLLDSRIDTVGDEAKPKSLVETFWLNELEKSLPFIAQILPPRERDPWPPITEEDLYAD